MIVVHHMDKWGYANLDLVEERLETDKKAIVLIAGASSSGKSFCATYLTELLKKFSHKAYTISLDQYNVGLSAIIPNKVNLNYFNGELTNIKEIEKRIKKIIYHVDFDSKYSDEVLEKIRVAVADLISVEKMNMFLKGLKAEWKVLNFDETSVYDLKEASDDVKALLEGKTITEKVYSKIFSERVQSKKKIDGSLYDVIIVEGIYALNSLILNSFSNSLIKNFIAGNPKSLFLRRIIRDAKISSANNTFTTKLYFTNIIKAYNETILPSRLNADCLFFNDMTFEEMRNGELYTTKDEIEVEKNALDSFIAKTKIISKEYQKDIFFSTSGEAFNDSLFSNVLRLREVSYDSGITYVPSSLVHKGVAKRRKDGKIIRPINVIIKEGEFFKVWDDENSCLKDFLSAGFLIGPVKEKIKTKFIYKGQELTLHQVEGDKDYLEFSLPYKKKVVDELKEKFQK